MNDKWRPAIAELVGTFIFFFIGAGSIVTNNYTHDGLGLVGIALAHGLALSVMVSALGAVSGAHFNPAVTIGAWVARKINGPTVAVYIAAQLIGGIFAGLLLRTIFPPEIWEP